VIFFSAAVNPLHRKFEARFRKTIALANQEHLESAVEQRPWLATANLNDIEGIQQLEAEVALCSQ